MTPAHPKDAYFAVTDLKEDLGRKTGRSATTVLIFSVIRLVISLGTIAVLARLLPPDVHGLIAMVWPIIVVAAGISEFGLPQAIIQRDQIGHHHVSALYWINCALGLVVTALAMAFAPAVAGFYGVEALWLLTIGLAPYILLTVMAVPYVAILRRRMEIRTAERCAFAGVIAGSVFAILAAVLGAGPWALVIQIVGAQGVTMVALMVAVKWRPSLPWQADFRAATGALAFGGQLSLDRLLSDFANQVPNIIVGRAFGDAAAGLFYRSLNFAQMPRRRIVGPLSGAFVPSLSRLQDDPDGLRAMYVRQVTRSNLILVPVGLIVLLAPDALVLALLGPDWTGAIPVMRWLGLLPLMVLAAEASVWVLVALGLSKVLLRARLLTTAVLIGAMLVGSRFDLVTFTAVLMLTQMVVAFVVMPMVIVRHSPVEWATLRAAYLGDAVFAILAAGVAFVARSQWQAGALWEGAGVAAIVLGMQGARVLLTPRYRADVLKALER